MKWYEKTHDTVHDQDNIKGFFGEYRYLSNYEACLVEYKGLVFNSSEAAYHSAKCKNPEDIQKFLNISANESKKLGRKIEIIDNWDYVKLEVMEEILRSKFGKNSHLRDKLISTFHKFIEETNWWNDKFWGVCDGEGENNLGKLLMKIREEYQNENNIQNISSRIPKS